VDGDDYESMKSMAVARASAGIGFDYGGGILFFFVCVLPNAIGAFTIYAGFDEVKPPIHGTVKPYKWPWQ
jgi:hypothetical protein